MTVIKHRIAHKHSDTEKWSESPKQQKKKLIAALQELIDHLESQNPSVIVNTAN